MSLGDSLLNNVPLLCFPPPLSPESQFKRNAAPDGPKVGSVALSQRGDWRMPSDIDGHVWCAEVARLIADLDPPRRHTVVPTASPSKPRKRRKTRKAKPKR